jgi:heterodisulfide reductase subunit C
MAEAQTKEKRTQGKASPEANLVPIYVMGERYMVPDSLTIQKALEYAGYQLVRGCGCRGGICGACGTVYRMPSSYRIEVGLACQTVVKADMHLTQIPFFPANKAVYTIEELKPTSSTIASLYPELFKCVGCNTCTRSCPMDIEVMEYISQSIRGNIAKVAELSFDCVMCGLCSARCPAEEVQYNVAILCRRLYGKHIAPKAAHLEEAVKKVEENTYEEGLKKLMSVNEEELKKLYVEREAEPEMADEFWTPEDKEYL